MKKVTINYTPEGKAYSDFSLKDSINLHTTNHLKIEASTENIVHYVIVLALQNKIDLVVKYKGQVMKLNKKYGEFEEYPDGFLDCHINLLLAKLEENCK